MNQNEHLDNDSTTFNKRINDLLAEIIKTKKELTSINDTPSSDTTAKRSKTKAKPKKDLWKNDYDLLYDRILDIKGIAQYNYIMAIEQFRALDISNYDSFSNYIYNKDIDIFKCRKGYIERTKLLRARRKGKTCPECHKALSSSSGVMVCKFCGYSSNTKNGAPDFRTGTDSSKHTCKHIDAITGAKKPPANIVKIIHYISTWLTDLKFIYRWLVDNHKLTNWIVKYKQITNESIGPTFFTKVIERTEENVWDYNIYKLFTDEFYELLEKAKRYSKLKSSNMEALSQDERKRIITAYMKSGNIKKIPEPNVTFKFEDVEYEVGLFFNTISLIGLSPSDLEDPIERSTETIELIQWIWDTFHINAAMPGLMFNFNDIYCQSDNVPKRYNFTQEYAYILHETFHVSYIDITVQDKKAIMNLVLKFNDFYKKHSLSANGRECNAPLFACTFMCILNQFPYFRKYRDAVKLQPIKDKNTSSRIRSEWFKFMNSNPDLMRTYSQEAILEAERMKAEEAQRESQSMEAMRKKVNERQKGFSFGQVEPDSTQSSGQRKQMKNILDVFDDDLEDVDTNNEDTESVLDETAESSQMFDPNLTENAGNTTGINTDETDFEDDINGSENELGYEPNEEDDNENDTFEMYGNELF